MTEDDKTEKIVFSGDIGNLDQPIIKDPAYTESADYIVMESTYGNRLHTQEKPDYLGDFTRILKETFDKGVNVVIPSFALGRTQELLYFIREIKEKELLKEYQNFEVYLDSPAQIHVYPAETAVEESRQINRLFQYSAMSKKPLIEDNISFAEIRQYIPGDAMNALNYKQTARRGELMVNDRE